MTLDGSSATPMQATAFSDNDSIRSLRGVYPACSGTQEQHRSLHVAYPKIRLVLIVMNMELLRAAAMSPCKFKLIESQRNVGYTFTRCPNLLKTIRAYKRLISSPEIRVHQCDKDAIPTDPKSFSHAGYRPLRCRGDSEPFRFESANEVHGERV